MKFYNLHKNWILKLLLVWIYYFDLSNYWSKSTNKHVYFGWNNILLLS